jgi:hypothetical protein
MTRLPGYPGYWTIATNRPMELLEFVIEKYLGPPTRRCGNGRSFWTCPRCGDPSFQTLPLHPRWKHWAKCHSKSCGFLEDVAGVLREFHNGNYKFKHLPDYSDRVDILDNLEREWREHERSNRRPVEKRGMSPHEYRRWKASQKKVVPEFDDHAIDF